MTLNNEISTYVSTALQNPKVALTVSGSTVATGSATLMDWIPGDIGFYASATGIIGMLVVIYNNIKGGISKRRLEKIQFELAALQKNKLKAKK